MRKILLMMAFSLSIVFSAHAFALLSMELTRGVAGAIPIAVAPFSVEGDVPSQDLSIIIANDLKNSGRFKVYSGNSLPSSPSNFATVKFDNFRKMGADDLVIGKVQALGGNRFEVSFQLLDVARGQSNISQSLLTGQKFTVSGVQLRALAHHISDLIYQQATGVRGIFSTRLAYVLVQRNDAGGVRYILEVADQDGFNPRPLLTSNEPIMSPAWSPNGKQIAYVSFEKHHAAIYVQDVTSGARRLITSLPGINGAPSWAPNGQKLAIVLSKEKSPNIYIYDLNTNRLTQVTNDFYLNTEPSWAPNGRSILYTSNRSGGKPQVYQIDLASHAISRVTFDGKYNARASFTPDGNHIVVLNQQSGIYNIGILDLDRGTFRVLTNSESDHGSPTMAPNGSMVLFETLQGGRGVLGMAATDGSVQIRLPARNGDVQDPAWSPFLS